MTDPVFGELRQEDLVGWWGKQTLDFGGRPHSVELLIHGCEDEITQRQRRAFERFAEKWPTMQENLIDALIKYYYDVLYRSYGPDDEEEAKKWWSELKTREDLLQAVTPEMIVVSMDFEEEEPVGIYLLFSRTWGGEDLDDNGIGVRYIDEEIDEIGYKNMAF